jgi:membrane protease subunit HflK
MLRKGQDRVRNILPRNLGGGRAILIVIVLVVIGWALTGFYRVQPNEQGVVLQFGEYSRTTGPGLQYHLPWPIESVELPSVTAINRIDIGFRGSTDGRTGSRDIPEESLMLTGDENIIDIDFTVLWRINDARAYLFNIRDPEATVQVVAESAMREIIGQTDIQPALTEARQEIEQRTRVLTQETLDEYGAGILIEEVQLQSVDPPSQVVDAFNDVLRARQDEQRLRNLAEAYANDILPRARGEAEQLIQQASAYREEVVSLAQGDADRFISVLDSYRLAPAVTLERLYLETIEEVFGGANMVIIESEEGGSGVVPYLPLNELRQPTVARGQ